MLGDLMVPMVSRCLGHVAPSLFLDFPSCLAVGADRGVAAVDVDRVDVT